MPSLLRITGRVLGGFLAFDLVGVGLNLAIDAVVTVHRVWERSSPLAYVLWFVVGVFCAVFIYLGGEDNHDQPAGRERGLRVLAVTLVVALLLGGVSSLVWSTSDAAEPVVPDHRGATLTYLITVVSTVAFARFVVFREALVAAPVTVVEPPRQRSHHASRSYDAAPLPEGLPPSSATAPGFRPAGLGGTLGWAVGVSVLLLLDVAFFVLSPFDLFDRWSSQLSIGSLVVGFVWGLAAARREGPREWLLAAHAPLLVGTVFYFFALLPGALLVSFGGSESAADLVSLGGFGLGFLLGGVAIGAKFLESAEGASVKAERSRK